MAVSNQVIFTPELNARIMAAHDLAARRGDTHSDVTHLMLSMLSAESLEILDELDRRGVDPESFRQKVEASLPSSIAAFSRPSARIQEEAIQVTAAFMTVLDRATRQVAQSGRTEVGVLDVLDAILSSEDGAVAAIVEAWGHGPKMRRRAPLYRSQSEDGSLRKLARYGRILTDEAREGSLDPVVGRRSELERLVHILGRRRKNNPVLLGEPGVGKTAIVEGLAQTIVTSAAPRSIAGKHIFALDVGSLVAGTKYRGEFESRIQDLLEAVSQAEGQIILFIDELHLIARAGGAEGAINAAGFLKPMLARGELRAIGATTVADYRQQIVRDGALERRFQPVFVREPSDAEALEMLRGLRTKYEEHHGVVITDVALQAAVSVGSRLPYRNLPDKAIDLVDEAASRQRATVEWGGGISGDAGEAELVVTDAHVHAVLEEWLGTAGDAWADDVYGANIRQRD